MPDRPQKIGKLLPGTSPPMLRLAKELARQRRVLEVIRAALPPALRQHCRALACRNGRVTLFVASATWATRLRYHTPLLLEKLIAADELGIRTVRVRILAPARPTPTARTPLRRRRLTAAGVDCLEATADAVSDARLSAALRRLAARGK